MCKYTRRRYGKRSLWLPKVSPNKNRNDRPIPNLKLYIILILLPQFLEPNFAFVYDSANKIKYFTCHQSVKQVMAFPFYKIKKPGKYTTNNFGMVVILCAMEWH